jgi:DNA-binding CsgD family transcriptional regulator
MDLPLAEMDAPLRELVEHDVIDPGGPRGLMDFRHQLLRDAMYRSVPSADLRRFHARAAEFGRALEGASEVHASVHYERAGMRAEAFRSALAGARAAARVLAHREAFDLFARATDNLPNELADADSAAIFIEAADSAAAREEMAAFERWNLEARRRSEAAGDHIGVARALLGLATLERRNAGPGGPRRELVEAALTELDQVPASPAVRALRCDVWYVAGIAAIDARDLVRAASAAERAMGEALAAGSAAHVGQCESLQGLVDVLRGDIATGRRRIAAEARRALAAGEGDAAITAYRWGGDILVQALDYRGALDFIDEGIRYADSIEQSYCPGILSSDAATVAWADGRWPEAEHRAREVIALRGSARAPSMARIPLAFVALGRGDLATARRLAAEAMAFGERGGVLDILVPALWAQAEIALIARDPVAAIELAERALALAEGSGERAQAAPFAVTGVRALLAAGRPADAQRWLDRVAALLDGTPWALLPAVSHARGLIALAEGSTGMARSALERAVAGWDAMPRIWEALWARCDLASVLLRTGRQAEAASLVSDVRERAAALDSQPLLERADELARNTRGHAPAEAAWHPLTSRELEVARCIAAGMTNNELAAELGIAPKTASAHVEHILAKLGAARRAEIAAWVASLGDSGRQRAASWAPSGSSVRRP